MYQNDENLFCNNTHQDSNSEDSSNSDNKLMRYTTAQAPVDKYDKHYNMNHPQRGKAIIFNHETFTVHNLPPRLGTNIDCEVLTKTCAFLGFSVDIYNDLGLDDINDVLEEIRETDHSNSDCLLIAVLTLGNLTRLYAKDTHYSPENLWVPFKADVCPTLAGKPKLFFIQACHVKENIETDGVKSYRIPTETDFLTFYCTLPGFITRNEDLPSVFIDVLCDEINHGGNNDILKILTFVLNRMASEFDHPYLPMIISQLIRVLVFNAKCCS